MGRTLVVTNDFPPQQGGIENYVYQLVRRLPPDQVVVFASSFPGAEAFDAEQPFPVVRARAKVLLPQPHIVRGAERLIKRFRCDTVYFGAAASLGLMAQHLRQVTSAKRLVGSSHSHECYWTKAPPTRAAIRSIAAGLDHLTYISAYCGAVLRRALPPELGARLVRLSPGVDPAPFRSADGSGVRQRFGLGDRPVILSVSRLVPAKGQDSLIRALPTVLEALPRARLLLVGDGARRDYLERLAVRLGVSDAVHLVGGIPHGDVADYYAAGDVFAFPARDRTAGLQVEGLGQVSLEAAAAGLPVIVGDSGGAPETVLNGRTGYVVKALETGALAGRLIELLADRNRAAAMGEAGRDWMSQQWTWDQRARILRRLLAGDPPSDPVDDAPSGVASFRD
ncbi:MAG: glycosyltransferase family 4 protein [Bifidobacteriaceae bacterium]|nr:glycosyltransferase family 4 protein [Bifidobacteriaceae bacterium]